MGVIPASSQRFEGPSIPYVEQNSTGVMALAALAAGLKGYTDQKAKSQDDMNKLLMALGPTLIANDQLGTQSRNGGPAIGNSAAMGVPLYANQPLSYNDVVNSGGNVPAKYGDMVTAANQAAAAPGQLAELVYANSKDPRVSGEMKVGGATYKIGDTTNPFSYQQAGSVSPFTGISPDKKGATQASVDFFNKKAGKPISQIGQAIESQGKDKLLAQLKAALKMASDKKDSTAMSKYQATIDQVEAYGG